MKTIFCTQGTPDAATAAILEWGPDARIGYPYSKSVAPYAAESHEVMGFVAAHRSGPRIPVVLPKVAARA